MDFQFLGDGLYSLVIFQLSFLNLIGIQAQTKQRITYNNRTQTSGNNFYSEGSLELQYTYLTVVFVCHQVPRSCFPLCCRKQYFSSIQIVPVLLPSRFNIVKNTEMSFLLYIDSLCTRNRKIATISKFCKFKSNFFFQILLLLPSWI